MELPAWYHIEFPHLMSQACDVFRDRDSSTSSGGYLIMFSRVYETSVNKTRKEIVHA